MRPQPPSLSIAVVNSSASPNLENRVRSHQKTLLKKAKRFLQGEPLSDTIRDSFLATPRHQFAPRFPDGQAGLWSDIEESLLIQHLDTLYADQPFCIYRDEQGNILSTISQPSLVIYMLHLLELEPGMSVFELGGGSGWNAALMGRIVGSEGHVFSVEVETALLGNARKALKETGLQNVSLIDSDAALGLAGQGPFDRGVFTASAWDLPIVFFDQIKEGGLLLFVLKFSDDCDLLAVLRKTSDAFVSELHFPCRFVPIVGKRQDSLTHTTSEDENDFHQWLSTNQIEPEDLDLTIRPASPSKSLSSNERKFDREDCSFIWSQPQ